MMTGAGTPYSTYTPGAPGWQPTYAAAQVAAVRRTPKARYPMPEPSSFAIAAAPVQPWIPGVTFPSESHMHSDETYIDPRALTIRAAHPRTPIVLSACRAVITGAFLTATTGMPVFAVMSGTRFFGH